MTRKWFSVSGLLREVLKKRSFYGQADRKGGWSEVKPAKNDDVIYEQPLISCILILCTVILRLSWNTWRRRPWKLPSCTNCLVIKPCWKPPPPLSYWLPHPYKKEIYRTWPWRGRIWRWRSRRRRRRSSSRSSGQLVLATYVATCIFFLSSTQVGYLNKSSGLVRLGTGIPSGPGCRSTSSLSFFPSNFLIFLLCSSSPNIFSLHCKIKQNSCESIKECDHSIQIGFRKCLRV